MSTSLMNHGGKCYEVIDAIIYICALTHKYIKQSDNNLANKPFGTSGYMPIIARKRSRVKIPIHDRVMLEAWPAS